MENFPKISLITPSFNDGNYLEETIQSVISQEYPNLEYIVIDGGSSDHSVDVLRKYEKNLTYWVSEKDNGMYHALQKGFDKATGEIMGWINSDDKHHSGSLSILAEIFSSYPEINWIQGVPNVIDEEGRVVYAGPRPDVDRFFFYSKKHLKSRKYIQQESTFWRRALWQKAGGYISQDYRFAGDFELWMRFFQTDKLYNVPAMLGAFRMTSAAQASLTHRGEYESETERILDSLPLSQRDRKYLRRYESRQRAERVVRKLIDYVLPATNNQSVINSRFAFDSNTQKLKMR